jgi:hypothetical protein
MAARAEATNLPLCQPLEYWTSASKALSTFQCPGPCQKKEFVGGAPMQRHNPQEIILYIGDNYLPARRKSGWRARAAPQSTDSSSFCTRQPAAAQ